MDQLSNLGQQADFYVLVVAFLIGLGGSAHCVGMCGPLVSATSPGPLQSAFYQVGRLLGYLTLTIVLGFVGKVFIFQYSKLLNSIFSAFLAAFFIFLGIRIFLKRPIQFKMPGNIQKIWGKLNFDKPSILKSGMTGLFSIFLPCGFLYAVVFSTMGFQNLTLGILSVVAFWLGTLPAMVSAPYLVNRLLKPFVNRRPQLTGFFLVCLGLLTILWRYQMSQKNCLFCH